MNTLLLAGVLALHFGWPSHPPSNLAAVAGTVSALDTKANTVTVTLPDSWDDKFLLSPKTQVFGAEGLIAAGPSALKVGSQVLVHYSVRGVDLDLAAIEIDQIGDTGMKTAVGTIAALDRVTKKLTLKGTDGVDQTYTLTDWALMEGPKDAGGKDGVTVYFAQEAGGKVAHYFGKPIAGTGRE